MLRKIALTTVLTAALVGAGASAASALETSPCPDGYTGIIVEHNGQETKVCQNVWN